MDIDIEKLLTRIKSDIDWNSPSQLSRYEARELLSYIANLEFQIRELNERLDEAEESEHLAWEQALHG